MQTYLDFINQVLSYIFIAEMVIKLLGMGVQEYCADSFNIFDGTVVIISIVEMIVSTFIEGGLGGGAISSLRAVRLLRVFKLARSWTSFRDLLAKMIITLKDIQYFACLMILFMFIFTLLGLELFAYKIRYNNEDKEEPVNDDTVTDVYYPRASFNNFGLGFTTIFIVFIGEDWNSVMYDHHRSQGIICVLIFVLIFIWGNLILLNLFLAILLQNFEEPPGKDEPAVETGPSAFTIFKEMLVQKLCSCCICCGGGQHKVMVVDDENNVEGQGPGESQGDQKNAQTPKAKKSNAGSEFASEKNLSAQGQPSVNDREIDELSPNKDIPQDKPIDLKAQTEVKIKDIAEEDNEHGQDDEYPEKAAKKLTQSENKRVTIDAQDAVNSPKKTKKFLRQRTKEMS